MSTVNSNSTTNVRRDENMWAMLCHISAFTVFFIPFGNIISPLVIWLIKKDELPFVDDQGKEALNFQITLTIYVIAASILSIVLVGIPLLIGFLIFGFVVTIIAAIKANDGEQYRYPMTIRFID